MSNRLLAISPALFGLLSVTLGFTGVFWCQTFVIRVNDYKLQYNNGTAPVSSTDMNTNSTINLDFDYYFSIYLYQKPRNIIDYDDDESNNNDDNDSSCATYPDYVNYDTSWKTAAILQVVCWIIAIFNSSRLLCMCCCGGTKNKFRCIGLSYILLCVTFEGLGFLIFKSEACTNNPILVSYFPPDYDLSQLDCQFGPSAVLMWISMFGYLLSGLLCLCLGPNKDVDDHEKSTKQQQADNDIDEEDEYVRACFCFWRKKGKKDEKNKEKNLQQDDVEDALQQQQKSLIETIATEEIDATTDEEHEPNTIMITPHPPTPPPPTSPCYSEQQQQQQPSAVMSPSKLTSTDYSFSIHQKREQSNESHVAKPDPDGFDRTQQSSSSATYNKKTSINTPVLKLSEIVHGIVVVAPPPRSTTSSDDEKEVREEMTTTKTGVFEHNNNNNSSKPKRFKRGVRFGRHIFIPKTDNNKNDNGNNSSEELYFMSCHET